MNTKNFVRHCVAALGLLVSAPARADGEEPEDSGVIEELTFLQHPGLPPASSKIFFSKRPYTVSGFGEISFIHHVGDANRATGDIELYNTNLYRLVVYGAARPTDWLVLYAEGFAELFQDGFREAHYEVLPEVFADFLLTNPKSEEERRRGPHIGPLNVRAGFIQVPIGFINENDEPIMFYSVNRPEVERIIVPTQWVELGVEVYGKLGRRAEYLVHAFQGPAGEDLLGATWLRRGRNPGYALRSPAVAAQVNVTPIDHLELSVSGVATESGSGARVLLDGRREAVRAPTVLGAAHARVEIANWTILALGSMGYMADTEKMFELTRGGDRGPQVLGERTYGYYFEVGCDVLPYFRDRPASPSRSLFYRADEVTLPLFARYERLDTHAHVASALAARLAPDTPIHRSNLDVVTVGVNFRPRRSLMFKADYQFRHNRSAGPASVREPDQLEIGVGFLF